MVRGRLIEFGGVVAASAAPTVFTQEGSLAEPLHTELFVVFGLAKPSGGGAGRLGGPLFLFRAMVLVLFDTNGLNSEAVKEAVKTLTTGTLDEKEKNAKALDRMLQTHEQQRAINAEVVVKAGAIVPPYGRSWSSASRRTPAPSGLLSRLECGTAVHLAFVSGTRKEAGGSAAATASPSVAALSVAIAVAPSRSAQAWWESGPVCDGLLLAPRCRRSAGLGRRPQRTLRGRTRGARPM